MNRLLAFALAAVALCGQTHQQAMEPASNGAPMKMETNAPEGWTLTQLEQIALQRSPRLRQAQLAIAVASGRQQQAGLWPNPTIGANGEHVSTVTGGGAIGGFVEQRIVMGRKLGLDRGVAEQDRKMVEQMAEAEKQRVLNDLRMLFYRGLAEERLIEVRTQLSTIAQHAVAISRELANVGQADKPDVLASEIEAHRVELSLINARNAWQRTWREITALLNDAGLDNRGLKGNLEAVPDLDQEKALATIYQESPELRAAEVEVHRQEIALRRAEVEKIPDLKLRGGLRNNNEYSDRPAALPRRVGVEGIFDIGVEIPIFNRNQGNVTAARAELERSHAGVERTRADLRRRLAQAFDGYLDARAAVGRYRNDMLPKAKQAYELYLNSFRQMAAAYPQVLIAQRNYFQVQEDYVTALNQAWERSIEIQGLLLNANEDRH